MKLDSLADRLGASLWPSNVNHASHIERWISAVGGFIGVLVVLWVSSRVLDAHDAALVVASMGASAVLLFAVPHGALSQPWALVAGHAISALIGVTCAWLVKEPMVAAALAVGASIAAMYYLHCLHPPGGATALVAVLGGEAVHQLGYGFVVAPVLANALILLVVAIVVNLPFRWRRYPAGLTRAGQAKSEAATGKPLIAHEDLVYALSQLDSFIDVSEEDLIRIYALAVHHPHTPVPCHKSGAACRQDDPTCFCRQLMAAEHPATT